MDAVTIIALATMLAAYVTRAVGRRFIRRCNATCIIYTHFAREQWSDRDADDESGKLREKIRSV